MAGLMMTPLRPLSGGPVLVEYEEPFERFYLRNPPGWLFPGFGGTQLRRDGPLPNVGDYLLHHIIMMSPEGQQIGYTSFHKIIKRTRAKWVVEGNLYVMINHAGGTFQIGNLQRDVQFKYWLSAADLPQHIEALQFAFANAQEPRR